MDADQFEALETAENLISSAVGLLLHHYGETNALVIAQQLVEDHTRSHVIRQARKLATLERQH